MSFQARLRQWRSILRDANPRALLGALRRFALSSAALEGVCRNQTAIMPPHALITRVHRFGNILYSRSVMALTS